MPEWIGKTVGKVRIEREIAKGGMAEVFLGTHLTLDRPVAVKVMHNYIEADPDFQSRFEREAKVVAALRHPNIIQIFDFDTADGRPYIVMEYLKGPSLASYLSELHKRGDRLPPARIARLLAALASAIDYAHEEGVIHRDIKPGNIILHNKARELSTNDPLTPLTEPVVTDFGLVRIVNSATQTASGMVSGTPAYMSPEQAQGVKVDHRSDIYSLGVLLYEMVAGRVPFEADTSWTVILKHINEAPPPITGIQPPVQGVIERVLAKNPDLRYQSCRDLAADYLEAIGLVAQSETMRFSSQSTPRAVPADTSARATPPSAPNFNSTQDQAIPSFDKRYPAASPVWMRVLPVAGLIILLLGLTVFAFSRLSQPASPTNSPGSIQTSDNGTHATSETHAVLPIDNQSSLGLLRFQDGTASGDQVTISTASMPAPPQGSQYEAWLIADDGEQRVSIGTLSFDPENRGTLLFVDSNGQNLIGKYHALEITIEPSPDNNPINSSDIAFSVTLPRNGFTHVRHLLFSYGATPNQVSLIHGLDATTRGINLSAEEMLTAFESGDEANVRLQAEEILNAIIGNQDPNYKDWNNDGDIDDESDGFGLLLNGENEGYIQGTISHAGFAAEANDATENMRIHGQHVQIAGNNIAVWTPQLRDQLTSIISAPFDSSMEGLIRQAVSITNQIQNGIDINGNENIEPIEGEGGVNTAYEHAYYMADMSIFASQLPVP
ncbi:MAG TPA: protein kinase [Anaerolineales bacterium]|nr:protein kinase [Anaerolineales bacterium]